MPSVFGELIDHEPFMVQSTLADQGLCQLQPDGQIAASCIRSHQQKRLFGILSVVIRIEHSLMRIHQGRQFRKNLLRNRLQVALPLKHSAELGQVGLEPVLLRVLLRGDAEIANHFVDVVLENLDLAPCLNRDRPRQVAFGYGRGHVFDRSHLGREVGGQLIYVVG